MIPGYHRRLWNYNRSKSRHFFGFRVMEDKAGFYLHGVLIQQPAVDHDMLSYNEGRGFPGHGAGIIPQKKHHGLGLIVFFPGQNPVDQVTG